MNPRFPPMSVSLHHWSFRCAAMPGFLCGYLESKLGSSSTANIKKTSKQQQKPSTEPSPQTKSFHLCDLLLNQMSQGFRLPVNVFQEKPPQGNINSSQTPGSERQSPPQCRKNLYVTWATAASSPMELRLAGGSAQQVAVVPFCLASAVIFPLTKLHFIHLRQSVLTLPLVTLRD